MPFATADLRASAAAIAATLLLGAAPAPALAQSAHDVRGASPYVAVENEPPPKLVVDPPLPSGLAMGLVQIQYRVENVHIVPVFGAAALAVSPRVGHLHVTVDDLPWHWTDTSDNNTIDIAGLPPGPHKVRIDLVNAQHQPFTSQTVTFTVPAGAPPMQ